MARLDRALVAVSNTLGQLANNAQDRQQEKWRAMRDENFMRLQHMLGEESRATDRTETRAMRKEEFAAESTERRGMFEEEKKARKEMFDAETTARRTENETERGWKSKENAADRAVQMSQITDKNGKDYDARYMAQLQQLDKRIQDLNDYKTQGNAEGKFVDASALTQVDSELAQLTEQRRTMAQERDVVLARGGDSRYRKMTAEEVANIRKENGGQMPGAPTAQPGPVRDREEEMAVAAQGPRAGSGGGTSIKIPQAPQKPQGMVEREARKQAPDRRAGEGAAGELALGDWQNPAPPQQRGVGQPQAFEGARDIVNVGRSIAGNVDSRKNEGSVVQAAKQALQSGKPAAAEVVQALAKIDRKRLTGVFGINEQDLAALGL